MLCQQRLAITVHVSNPTAGQCCSARQAWKDSPCIRVQPLAQKVALHLQALLSTATSLPHVNTSYSDVPAVLRQAQLQPPGRGTAGVVACTDEAQALAQARQLIWQQQQQDLKRATDASGIPVHDLQATQVSSPARGPVRLRY